MRATLRTERRLRDAIRVASTGALGGIALSASEATAIGGFITVACIVWLVWSLHRLGRLGPDASATFRS